MSPGTIGVSAETLKSVSTPDRVESRIGTLEFDDGAPTEATAKLLYDQLDFANGVQAFLGGIAGASLADAHGDASVALKTLESGLRRHPQAGPLERARALLYRGDVAMRLGDSALARSTLKDVRLLELDPTDLELLAEEITHVTSLVAEG